MSDPNLPLDQQYIDYDVNEESPEHTAQNYDDFEEPDFAGASEELGYAPNR